MSNDKDAIKKVIVNALIWVWDESGGNGAISGTAKYGSFKIDNQGKLQDIIVKTDEKDKELEEDVEIIDAKGKLVIPGLHDGHIHVEMTGESSYFVNLGECHSIESLQQLLSSHSEKNPDLPWIIGVNWDQTNMQGRYPTRYDLDAVCPDRPVFLWRVCWHIGCVNSVGLERDGIPVIPGAQLPSTPGGVIEIDPSTNSPTGMVKERATELIIKAMGTKSQRDKRTFILDGLEICRKFGLTSVQTNDENAYEIYKQL